MPSDLTRRETGPDAARHAGSVVADAEGGGVLRGLARTMLSIPDVLLAGLVGLGVLGLAGLRLLLPARRAPDRRRRRLLVLDTAWSLHVIRGRGLEHSITCRDLRGYFEHVWTVHPLVGAGHDDPPDLAVAGITTETVSGRHTVVEGHIGRFRALRVLPRTNFILAQAGLFWHLDRLIRREHIAALRVVDPYYPGLLGLALARANRIPLVIRVGGPWDAIHAATGRLAYPRIFRRRWVEKRVDRFVLPRADLVAGTNQDNLDYALRNRARPERSTLFPYGNLIDASHFLDPSEREPALARLRELGLEGRPFAVYVARLERIKNGDDLVHAVAAAREDAPELAVVLVGEGTLRAELQALARGSGVEGHVVLAGSRDQAWLASVLPAAACVVALSAGRALVEGALSGRPVVAYDVEWHAEFIRDGVNGVLVPYKDRAALAAALVRCVQDPEWAARLGRQGREDALREHDPEALDAHEAACYERLIADAVREEGAVP